MTSTSANHRNAIERRVNEDMHRLDEPISISLEPLEGLQVENPIQNTTNFHLISSQKYKNGLKKSFIIIFCRSDTKHERKLSIKMARFSKLIWIL